MYRIPIAFHNRLNRGENPISYILILTHLGYRAYCGKELSRTFDRMGYIADGSFIADGSITAGGDSIGLLDKGARVLDMGTLERTIQPKKDDVMAAYSGKQLQHISIDLDNADAYFSRLIAKEPFLGRPVSILCGFEQDGLSAHISLFTGIISELSAMPIMTLEADER